jgi:hypothetical protein
MSFIKANHSKATEGFKPMPAGKYEAIIEAGAFKHASTGAPMINWKFAIRDDVEGQEVYKGRFQFSNLVFTEATEGVVNGFLKAIGVPDGMEFPDSQALIDYATGKAVEISVKIKKYEGEDRNEVGFINASKVGGGKVDDPFLTLNAGDPLDNGGTYTRVEEDPFANSSGPIEVSDDDLPF